MKITAIDMRLKSSPLSKTFKTSLRVVEAVESLYVFIHTDSGAIGLGEAVPTHAITGDTIPGICGAIHIIKERLIGQDISIDLLPVIQQAIIGNTSAKAALDMAVYDLLAREQQQPLYEYLGGTYQEFETSYTVSLNRQEEMTADALQYKNLGFNYLKVKLGGKVEEDIERIQAIREAVGEDVKLGIDANQGWSVKDAVKFCLEIERRGIGITVIEQPVFKRDIKGLAEVKRNTKVPIMADESLFCVYDAKELVEQWAADKWNIKLMKTGGLYEALKIHQIASVPCMVGSMMESHVSVTAALHLTMAINADQVDFDAPLMLKEKPVSGGIHYEKNYVTCNRDNGLGINNTALWEELKDEKSM
ncbi:dipeptide epimerase [Macrococcus lamae]|uniref:Dipeptide epimerase n=1 Tax=Macrococcus lamae TaxID=198484 RepID=A0A4R6BU80_9STAP|nr:dipeptide epimerase [Macrococcus lamae]TDM10464.1 dipeptide epimerase [Macrococcus lamae]